MLSHHLGRQMERQKKLRDGRGLGNRGLLIDHFKHNNQPKRGSREKGEYEGEARQAGGTGEAQYHCFGGRYC
jgi:hypothetical protein